MLATLQDKVRQLRANRRYLTSAKLANLLLNQVEIRARRTRLISRPYVLQLEPFGACNTDCQLCPVGLKLMKGARGPGSLRLSYSDFKRILAPLERYLVSLNFGLWGEPALNRDLARMIDHAQRARINTTILTNGHLFGKQPNLARELFDAGLNQVLISLHGLSPASYGAYQPSKRFVETMAAIERISAVNQGLARRRRISLAFAITSKNEHEVEAFKAECARLRVEAYCYPASMAVRALETLEQKRATIEEWLPRGHYDDFAYPYYQALLDGVECNPHPVRCQHLTSGLSVLASGEVVTCCEASPRHGETFESSGLIRGNLLTPGQTVESIWNSASFRRGRAYVFKGVRCPGEELVCHSCCAYTT